MNKVEIIIARITCFSVCSAILICTLGWAFTFDDDRSDRFEVHSNSDDDDPQSVWQDEDEDGDYFTFILYYDTSQRKKINKT